MMVNQTYNEFLESKIKLAQPSGIEITEDDIKAINIGNKKLKPHEILAIQWAAIGGRRALFESFGLGKTCQQLGLAKLITDRIDGKFLQIMPLGVKQEFKRDAEDFYNIELEYVKTLAECKASKSQILITNYERVRDGDIDPNYFLGTSLDEASVLRGYGTKTYQTFLTLFDKVRYRFVATATPSPNIYKELIHYAGFLDIMDTGQALTRFFKRDSTKANNLTLYPHKEQEFWLWVSSWALFITKPSDLGFDDTGYDLPTLNVIPHRLEVDHTTAGAEPNGQGKMFRDAALSLSDASKEKRDSLDNRITQMMSIITQQPDDHFIIWHDLEAERHAIKKALPEVNEIYGTLDLDIREQRTIDFSDGKIQYVASKPEISGSGVNWQRFCNNEIFLGIGYKFNDFLQAIHRCYRFLQDKEVNIHIIYTESEDRIFQVLMQKWKQHDYLVQKMVEIIKKYNLSVHAIEDGLKRSFHTERYEVKKSRFIAINNDNVIETKNMKDNSVHLITTSIPFSNHYEYTPTYNDFGHNEDNDKFFEQMDYLTPELFRMMKPGRVAAIHTKDRILFGNATGDGMPTVDPFSDLTVAHFMKHGFRYMGRIIILTDVVRENNQTYRLGWSEQSKDGTKMGIGCPEYVLLFRKLPTDTTRAYADEPVKKSKKDYTRGRWQVDAHAFWKSSGNRFLTHDELKEIPIDKLQAKYREFSRQTIYNYKDHVKLSDYLDEKNKLPASFMVVAPGSWSDLIWDDVNRMRTLNGNQSAKNLQMHICLAKGSLVLTKERGYIPIETIKIGENVLTHKGNWKPVITKKMTGINNTIKIKGQGIPGLILTPTHKVWSRKSKRIREREGAEYISPEWIEAKNIRGAYVNQKLPEEKEIDIKENLFWWIVGRWIADGHFDKRDSIIISCGYHEIDKLKQKLDFYAGAINDTGTAIQIRVLKKHKLLKKILKQCGNKAHNKKLPPIAFTLPWIQSKALLDGYLSGDGHFSKDRKRYMVSSVSKQLLLELSILIQKVYNSIASIYEGRPERKSIIQGREVNCKQDYILCFDIESGNRRKKQFILKDGAWKKIRTIEKNRKVETWNIRIQDDESYTAEGCIVKNCPLQFDIVERLITRYSNENEIIFDPFAGLFTVPYLAVKMNRIGIGIELNPDSFSDGLYYMNAAQEEYEMPNLFEFIDLMEKKEIAN